MKKSIGSKIFFIAYIVVLVALAIFATAYLIASRDFVEPISFKIDNDSYDYNMDEFAAYLLENGYISTEEYTETDNIAGSSEARKYGDITVLYWNTAEMDQNSDAYTNWKTYSNVGNYVADDGTKYIIYGQFGVTYKEKAADSTEESYKFLESFPVSFSGNHGGATVYDYTFEEFLAYLDETGLLNSSDKIVMTTIGTENWIINGVDIIWWDVDNLVEGTDAYNYWTEFQENGYILFGGAVYMPTFNGPFAININSTYPGDANALTEAFMNFPKNYSGKH